MTRSKTHNQEISDEPFQCKAQDIGLPDYLVCLEKTSNALMCAHRFGFGFDHLCASPERIEQMRSRK
jgi:hypothetical protein